MAYKDYEDQKRFSKQWYDNNKPHVAEVKKLRLRKKKEDLLNLFGGKCSKCGYSKCIAALEFHHINPEEKDFTITSRIYWPFKRLVEEAKKCVILCANCHAEEHFS